MSLQNLYPLANPTPPSWNYPQHPAVQGGNISLIGPFRALLNTDVVFEIDGYTDVSTCHVKVERNLGESVACHKFIREDGDVGIQFRPASTGTYTVWAEIAGKHVAGSPAVCEVCHLKNIDSQLQPEVGVIGQEFRLLLSCDRRDVEYFTRLGDASRTHVNALVTCKALHTATRRQEPCTVREISPATLGQQLYAGRKNFGDGNSHVWEVLLQPQSLGQYMLYPMLNDCPIPNSPFICTVIDTNQIHVDGPGLRSARIYEDTWFRVQLPPGCPDSLCNIQVFQPEPGLDAARIRREINTSGLSIRSPFMPGSMIGDASTLGNQQLPYNSYQINEVSMPHHQPTPEVKPRQQNFPPFRRDRNNLGATNGYPRDSSPGIVTTPDGRKFSELASTRSISHAPSQCNTLPDGSLPVAPGTNAMDTIITCKYRPNRVGAHEIFIDYKGVCVPKCPFICHVFDASRVQLLNTPTQGWVGKYVEFAVDCVEAGRGEITETVEYGNNQTLPIMIKPVEASQHILWSQFLPRQAGNHLVNVEFNREPVRGSPFTVRVEEPQQPMVVAPQTYAAPVVQPTLGPTATASETMSYLSESVLANETAELRIFFPQQQNFTGMQYPQAPSNRGNKKHHHHHHHNNAHNQQNNNGVVDIRRFTDIREVPTDLQPIQENSPGGANCLALIRDPNGEIVPNQILFSNVANMYIARFIPRVVGEHRIDFTRFDKPAEGSPFSVRVFNPNKAKVFYEKYISVNQEASFKVDTSKAGHAPMNVLLNPPPGQEQVDTQLRLVDGGVNMQYWLFNFVPPVAGAYLANVYYGNLPVPGSPFEMFASVTTAQQNNLDRGLIVYGEGLTRAIRNERANFFIDWPEQAKQSYMMENDANKPTVCIKGPNTHVNSLVERDRIKPGLFNVSYLPTEVGEFNIDIDTKTGPVYGSPFRAIVVAPETIRCISDPQAHAHEVLPMHVGKKRRLVFDCTDAGPGRLSGEVLAPDGSQVTSAEVCRPSINTGHHRHWTLLFRPELSGKYRVNVWWEGLRLECAPIYCDDFVSHQGGMREYGVSLYGDGLRECSLNEPAQFVIDGQSAPSISGKPRVNLTDIFGHQIPVAIACDDVNKRYNCTYVSDKQGRLQLEVFWGEHQVRGSPFHINSQPSTIYSEKKSLLLAPLSSAPIRLNRYSSNAKDLHAHTPPPFAPANQNQTLHPPVMANHRQGGVDVATYDLRNDSGHHNKPHQYESPASLSSIRNIPNASKVHVYGPGVESGVLHCFESRFVCDTRGAGAGQLTVKVRGPQGAFRVELEQESQQDRRIVGRYEPTEPGEYFISVKWSGVHVPGSPFHVHIFRTAQELEQYGQRELSFSRNIY